MNKAHFLKIATLLFTLLVASTSILISIVEAQTFVLEGVRTWYWVDDTRMESVYSADVDGDGQAEIITGVLGTKEHGILRNLKA